MIDQHREKTMADTINWRGRRISIRDVYKAEENRDSVRVGVGSAGLPTLKSVGYQNRAEQGNGDKNSARALLGVLVLAVSWMLLFLALQLSVCNGHIQGCASELGLWALSKAIRSNRGSQFCLKTNLMAYFGS